jgi:large subunit ribosomal protein L31
VLEISGSRLIRRPPSETTTMKEGIHPEYGTCTVRCGCGNTFETRSTVKEIHAEICSACHPFFTGQEKFIDTAGRVERFQKKFGGEYFAKKTRPKTAVRPKL